MKRNCVYAKLARENGRMDLAAICDCAECNEVLLRGPFEKPTNDYVQFALVTLYIWFWCFVSWFIVYIIFNEGVFCK